MNNATTTLLFPPLSLDDPRITALALGEIEDPAQVHALREAIAADAALQRAFDDVLAISAVLQKEFHAELATATAPTAKTAPSVPSPHRDKRRARVVGAVAHPDMPLSPTEKIIRFVFWGASALGAAAMLFYTLRVPTADPSVPSPETAPVTVATAPTPATEVRVQLPASADRPASFANGGSGSIRLPAGYEAESQLASLVSRLPVRVSGGENAFVPTAANRPASLCLSTAGVAYARHLQGTFATGHIPPRKLVRIDGLVNAFLSAPVPSATPAAPAGIQLIAEAIPAPWAQDHWLVRATVLAGEMDGTVAATDARATIAFRSGQVASWRMLGCEDGDAGAVSLDVPVVVRSGESLTTLFEIVPAAGAKSGDALGELKIVFRGKNGVQETRTHAVPYPAAGGLAQATDDMRFAAAVASFGLTVRQSPHRGLATLDMAGQLVRTVKNPNKLLFDALMRESVPFVN